MAEPPLLVGISGPSSSGKTTLSRLLRSIFPPGQLTILHLDDFYRTDALIPVKNGVQDWDCLESLDVDLLHATVLYIKEHGTSPPDFQSKEDQNSVGDHGVSTEILSSLTTRTKDLVRAKAWKRKICIIDGFLLFSEDMAKIRSAFDVRLFLRTSYETAKKRREARQGYVTLEGFWEDPPGYVDNIVWPNYVQDHSFLFRDGNVEGDLDGTVCRKVGIEGMPREAEGSMALCLEWATSVLEREIAQVSQPSETRQI